MSRHRVSTPRPGKLDNRLTSQELQLLTEGRGALEGAIAQQNQLAPYLLQQAGLDFDLGPDGSAQLNELNSQRSAAASDLASLASLSKKDKAALKSKYGLKGGGDLRAFLRKRVDVLSKQAGAASATPRQISNIRENEAAAAQRRADQALQSTYTQRAQQAASGELPDMLSGMPEVKRELERQKAIAEERVRRQLGSAGEISTPGSQALNDFSKFSLEAIGNQARQNVAAYGGLSMAAGQQQLQSAGAKQSLASFTPQMGASNAMSMGQYAQGYNPLLAIQQGDRGLSMQGKLYNASQPTTGDYVLKGIGSLFSGVRSQAPSN